MNTLAARLTQSGPLGPSEAVGWTIRLAKSVEQIHAKGDLHGGLSPECVTVDQPSPRSQGILLDLRRSSIAYHSPERINGAAPTQADDVWAVAVTLAALLLGKAPFQGSEPEIRQAVMATPPPFVKLGLSSAALLAILNTALSRDPARRHPSMITLRQALERSSTDPTLSQLPPLEEDDDENQPTMIRSSPADEGEEDEATVSINVANVPGMPPELAAQVQPQNFPAPRPAAGAAAPLPAAGAPPPSRQVSVGTLVGGPPQGGAPQYGQQPPYGQQQPAPQYGNPSPFGATMQQFGAPPEQPQQAARFAPTMRIDAMPPGMLPPGMMPPGMQPQMAGAGAPAGGIELVSLSSKAIALAFTIWFVVTLAGAVAIFLTLRK